MKALLLVGGKGTRLRPLTIHAPKSIVPIFNRPFLNYQLDLIKQVKSLNPDCKVMLVSDYEDAQDQAVANGAVRGFGKSTLEDPATLDLIKATAGVQS